MEQGSGMVIAGGLAVEDRRKAWPHTLALANDDMLRRPRKHRGDQQTQGRPRVIGAPHLFLVRCGNIPPRCITRTGRSISGWRARVPPPRSWTPAGRLGPGPEDAGTNATEQIICKTSTLLLLLASDRALPVVTASPPAVTRCCEIMPLRVSISPHASRSRP
jgi:hypothetical protein